MLRFRGLHSNSVGVGHEDNVYISSLQMNVSFMTADQRNGISLVESLGRHQGCNHVDPNDCICGYTVFTLICSAPEGFDIGPFCFPESGAFAHSAGKLDGFTSKWGNVYVAILVFKGRSLHGGLAPRTFWDAARSTAPSGIIGVRIGLVAYPNGPAVNRTGVLATGPPNGFSSPLHLALRLQHQRTMLQAGLRLFGTRQSLVNFIAREYAFINHNNFAIFQGMVPYVGPSPFSIHETLSRIWFWDEHGRRRWASQAGILDPIVHHDEYIKSVRLFEHYRQICVYFNKGITKPNVKRARANASRAPQAATVPPFMLTGGSVLSSRIALCIRRTRAMATVCMRTHCAHSCSCMHAGKTRLCG